MSHVNLSFNIPVLILTVSVGVVLKALRIYDTYTSDFFLRQISMITR